jgi:hypothetical protein
LPGGVVDFASGDFNDGREGRLEIEQFLARRQAMLKMRAAETALRDGFDRCTAFALEGFGVCGEIFDVDLTWAEV